MHYLWFSSMVSKILLLRRGVSNTMTAESPNHHAQLKITSTYKSYLETTYRRRESIKNKLLLNTSALFPITEHRKPFKLKEQRTKANPESNVAGIFVEWKQNVVVHAQKPDLVFQRNGRVHFYRRGCQFSRLLAAEVCASAVVMLDRPCSDAVQDCWLPSPFAFFPFTSPPVRFRVPPDSVSTLPPDDVQ